MRPLGTKLGSEGKLATLGQMGRKKIKGLKHEL